jgi:hypothetical protein
MPDKKTVYDSIISRLRSGRDSKNEKELREAFKNILKQLEKQKMLTSEGKNWLHKRIPKDFKLTSDMVNSTGKRHLDRVYKVHMRKKASVLGGMLKKAENEKGKKRNIQRAIAKKAPLLGLAGAGFGTGYDVQNRYRGMALGGLAGAGLGAAAGYSQGKLSNKLRKRKVEKYENMPESDFRNELGLSVALNGIAGHRMGKSLAPLGEAARFGKGFMGVAKDMAKQENRRENSIDVDYDVE